MRKRKTSRSSSGGRSNPLPKNVVSSSEWNRLNDVSRSILSTSQRPVRISIIDKRKEASALPAPRPIDALVADFLKHGRLLPLLQEWMGPPGIRDAAVRWMQALLLREEKIAPILILQAPPCSGKKTLALALAAFFGVPLLRPRDEAEWEVHLYSPQSAVLLLDHVEDNTTWLLPEVTRVFHTTRLRHLEFTPTIVTIAEDATLPWAFTQMFRKYRACCCHVLRFHYPSVDTLHRQFGFPRPLAEQCQNVYQLLCWLAYPSKRTAFNGPVSPWQLVHTMMAAPASKQSCDAARSMLQPAFRHFSTSTSEYFGRLLRREQVERLTVEDGLALYEWDSDMDLFSRAYKDEHVQTSKEGQDDERDELEQLVLAGRHALYLSVPRRRRLPIVRNNTRSAPMPMMNTGSVFRVPPYKTLMGKLSHHPFWVLAYECLGVNHHECWYRLLDAALQTPQYQAPKDYGQDKALFPAMLRKLPEDLRELKTRCTRYSIWNLLVEFVAFALITDGAAIEKTSATAQTVSSSKKRRKKIKS